MTTDTNTPTPTQAHAEGMRTALIRTASAMGRKHLEALDLAESESDRRLVQSLYAYEARGAMGGHR